MAQNRFLMFLIGLAVGLFIAWVPLSIAVYFNQSGYHLAHYLVLTVSSIFFGGLAAVQQEKFSNTIQRVLDSMTWG